MRIIAYYPQSEQLARYYETSKYYLTEDKIVPIENLVSFAKTTDEIVIVGREGNSHHADIDHIKMFAFAQQFTYVNHLKKIRGIQSYNELTVVCFDWHHDIDNEVQGTSLTPGSWIFYGLEHNLFRNAYILGANPKIDNEVEPATGKVLDEYGMVIRMFDRIRLFTGVIGVAYLKYDPVYEKFLADNPSVRDYHVSSDKSFVEVTYKTWDEVDYRDLQRTAIVSIDLDVLNESEVKSDCPQGMWKTDDLIGAIRYLKPKTQIMGWAICGADVRAGRYLDEKSLSTIARIINVCVEDERCPL
jgi:hypothetical protein